MSRSRAYRRDMLMGIKFWNIFIPKIETAVVYYFHMIIAATKNITKEGKVIEGSIDGGLKFFKADSPQKIRFNNDERNSLMDKELSSRKVNHDKEQWKQKFRNAYERKDYVKLGQLCEDYKDGGEFLRFIDEYRTKKEKENQKYKKLLKPKSIADRTGITNVQVSKALRGITGGRNRLIIIFAAMHMSIDEINEGLRIRGKMGLTNSGADLLIKNLLELGTAPDKIMAILQIAFPKDEDN